MNLDQSIVLVDRALVTLCAELPESLGLYNTAKDEFTIGALRSIPMLEHLMPESRKHHIIRDWMRTYEEHEDQPLSSDVSFVTLREIAKKERKQRAKEARERNAELLSDGEEKPVKERSKQDRVKANGKAKAKAKAQTKPLATVASAKKKAEAKAKRKAKLADEIPSDSDASTSSTPSSDALDDVDDSSSSDDSSLDDSSSDDDKPRRSKNKSRSSTNKTKQSKGKGKEKRGSSAAKEKRRSSSGRSNLPPVEVVLSSDEEDEPDALFDAEDPDVYEVETILDKQPGRFGEPDKYLIKWVGYEETTWEPADNVSKDLIDEFEGQPVRENEYVVEEILDRKTVRDKQTKLKTFKYLVKWVGYEDKTWEPAENLPHNLRRKFDTKYEARKRRRMS